MYCHIDGDLLKYRCGFAAEGEPVSHALQNVKLTVQRIMDALDVHEEEVVVHLSGSTNFRNDIATIKKYKGNRDAAHKPEHGEAIIEYLKENYKCIVSDNEEADDTMGWSQYSLWLQDPYSSIIVSTDKDMNMIPGLHYNWVKEEAYDIDLDSANHFFWVQLLTGDSTDNIPGVPGIGPKKAKDAYKECTSTWDKYRVALGLYATKYDDPDAALLENARLLWIRRYEGSMWHPPHEEDL